jgi:peptidoglycan L-alanyl-D-glutamate endopeptidase CwlK
MSKFILGKRSKNNLVGVHPVLIQIVIRALELSPVDFFVDCGVRTPERQAELYAQGRTKPGAIVTWTLRSNHFVNKKTGFGHAVDLIPLPVDWKNLKAFDAVAKAMFLAANELSVELRWGADWDQDGNPRERGETDSPHFEIVI